MRIRLLVILGLGATLGSLSAGDWPQWRGPNRDGRGKETGLLAEWPKGGPTSAWMIDTIGVGYSSPAVVGDRIYILGGLDGKEVAFALDATTGKIVWQTPFGPLFKNAWGDGPRSTPTVVGEDVVALGAQGVLACFDRTNGAIRWSLDLRKDLGGIVMRGNFVDMDWGYSESPIVDGNRVIVAPGGKGGTVAAIDRKTGKIAWRTSGLTHAASYASSVIFEFGGVRAYVVFTGGVEISSGGLMKDMPKLIGVKADDGTILWDVKPNYTTSVIAPTPVLSGDSIFVTCGYAAGCSLFKLTATKDTFTAKTVYANKSMKNYHGGVVLFDGVIYGHYELVGWVAVELASGKLLWEQKNRTNSGAMAEANGLLYALGDDARVFLLKPDRDGWESTGEFDLPGKSKARTANGRITTCSHPVVANGRLYLRDQERLYCYDVTARP